MSYEMYFLMNSFLKIVNIAMTSPKIELPINATNIADSGMNSQDAVADATNIKSAVITLLTVPSTVIASAPE